MGDDGKDHFPAAAHRFQRLTETPPTPRERVKDDLPNYEWDLAK